MKTFSSSSFIHPFIPVNTTTSRFPILSPLGYFTRPLHGELLPLLSFTPEHLAFCRCSLTPLRLLDLVVQVSQCASLSQSANSRSTQTQNPGHETTPMMSNDPVAPHPDT